MNMTGRGSRSIPWLITPANGSHPDGLMCIVCVASVFLLCCEMRDECGRIWSCAACTSLIIIFIDEYRRGQDDEVAICVLRLSHANTEPGLCRRWNLVLHRPVSLVTLQLLLHTHTHSLPFMPVFKFRNHLLIFSIWNKCSLQTVLCPDYGASTLSVQSSL